MHENKEISNKFSFISGTGKAAEELRNFPWENTVLGSPENWPQTLKTTVSTMLKVDLPMYLVWGRELIQFYNDAFRRLVNSPKIQAGKSAENKNYLNTAFNSETNIAQISELHNAPYFSFSPVYGENQAAEGVLAVPGKAESTRYESLFNELIIQAPVGIAVLKGENHVYDVANDKYLEIIDRARTQTVGKPMLEALPELAGQGFEELLNGVMKTGTPFIGNEFEVDLVRNGEKQKVYVNFIYSPYRENDEIVGVMVVVIDVSSLVKSRMVLQENEKQLRAMIMQSPVPVAIFRGKDYVIEMANQVMFDGIWRKKPEDVLGKKLLDVFPELKEQKYPELLENVLTTGLPYSEKEAAVTIVGQDGEKIFYFDYEYAPLVDDAGKVSGVLSTVNDVTEKVHIRKKIQESETRQKIAIESAEIGTFDWDIIHSEFIYSERLAQIFGFTDTKGLKHNHFSGLIHPDDVAMRLKAHKESFRTGKLFYEARFIKPDKALCWLRLNGKVFFDENHVPQRMYGTVLDITAHKTKTYELENQVQERTEQIRTKDDELKRSEERYRRMTDEVQDYAIILLSPDGTVLNWNKGAQKIKGYTEEEIIGKNFSLFYLQEDRQNHVPEKIIQEATTYGRASHEGWRIRKDDSIFWGSIVVTALHDNDDNIIGFSKVTRDLTERKIAEDRLKQYTIELEFQNKELEQFAYIASHDLQEPLRKIQTFSSMLQNSLEKKESAELFLEKIKSSAYRMTELIKAVLNYSKLSTSAIEKEHVNLNELFDQIKVDFELLISEKNAQITYTDLPEIGGISLQMMQLFSNLIGNSLKFAEKEPVITITSRFLEGREILKYPNLQIGVKYVEIVVADNGIGFEKQYAAQIFNMFQRLHDKQTYSGTGIGLALCKRIVENHHGYISATSVPGEGARFHIFLPV